MRKTFFFFALLLAGCSTQVEDKHMSDASQESQFLFVISSQSGSYLNDTLTLKPIPHVVYFSDEPHRVAGHLGTSRFIEKWNEQMGTFKKNPPEAILSIANQGEVQDAVIELMRPQYKNGELTFRVKILEGNIGDTFGPNSLFIDLYNYKI